MCLLICWGCQTPSLRLQSKKDKEEEEEEEEEVEKEKLQYSQGDIFTLF